MKTNYSSAKLFTLLIAAVIMFIMGLCSSCTTTKPFCETYSGTDKNFLKKTDKKFARYRCSM